MWPAPHLKMETPMPWRNDAVFSVSAQHELERPVRIHLLVLHGVTQFFGALKLKFPKPIRFS